MSKIVAFIFGAFIIITLLVFIVMLTIHEEAKQKVIQAEAEAKAMAIKSEALSKNKALVEYEAVLKWNGELPQYMMGNSVPFINVSK